MQAVAGRTGLVAEVHALVFSCKAPDEPAHGLRRGVDLPEVADLAPALAISNRDGVARLGHVHADENLCRVNHGSSSYGEGRLGHSDQPSTAQCRVSHLTSADMRSYDADTRAVPEDELDPVRPIGPEHVDGSGRAAMQGEPDQDEAQRYRQSNHDDHRQSTVKAHIDQHREQDETGDVLDGVNDGKPQYRTK
jgi:hypothetical protein